MKKAKIRQRLLRFFKKNPNVHFIKGDLLRIAQSKLKEEGISMYDETIVRVLRSMAEEDRDKSDNEGRIVSYTNNKNKAFYFYSPSKYEKIHKQMQLI